jgi:mannose-6-phosphate isomerase-like protein (cupin superfamily)
MTTGILPADGCHTIAADGADQPADGFGGPIMSTPQAAAQRLAGTALAPPGSQLVLAEWTAQGSTGDEPLYQAPLHEHQEDEAWYVLEGTLAVRAGEQVHQIPAGGAVVVPGGTAHTFWNPRPDPARYVLIMGARTFALIQAIHATDDRSPARMRQLYAEHGATLLG